MRHLSAAAVLALALVVVPTARAQYLSDPLVGYYVNATNGGTCAVIPMAGGGYLFVNEKGDQAAFAFYSPQRLAITRTLYWDASIVATVTQDVYGRLAIQFASPSTNYGVWVRAR